MPRQKISAEYDKWNPLCERATHIALDIETNPPYVSRVYYPKDEIPALPEDLLLLTKRQADILFDFKKRE